MMSAPITYAWIYTKSLTFWLPFSRVYMELEKLQRWQSTHIPSTKTHRMELVSKEIKFVKFDIQNICFNFIDVCIMFF